MAQITASEAALAAIKEVVVAYRFHRPVLCVLRFQSQVDLIRDENGEPVWKDGTAAVWSATVSE
jgi:hypothetical protein